MIFDKFNVNIWKSATLPSLAFRIYRSNYLGKFQIPRITSILYDEIKSGFTGGSTDMFIPYSDKPVYCYDVNSLYPYVMAEMDMPVGKITYFDGDILQIDPEAFGFFDVEITTPEDINIPILQTHARTDNGYRTISPKGTWRGMYFSEEIKNARKFGYKFKVLRGYRFEKAKIFKGYITELYSIKENSLKTDAMYLISKLLMNSLFGRFSMDYKFNTNEIVSGENFDVMTKSNLFLIYDFLDLGEDNKLVTYEKFDLKRLEQYENDFQESNSANVSIPISAAITAYARIHMSQFKIPNQDFKLFYTDTDSIFIDKPLDKSMIGKELGKMKLEYILEKSIFITSKIYGGQIQGEDKSICKIKGYKEKVSIKDLEKLLIKDKKLELFHEKWFKDLAEGNIQIVKNPYNLAVTDNKRKLVYENNILVGTEPYSISTNSNGENQIDNN